MTAPTLLALLHDDSRNVAVHHHLFGLHPGKTILLNRIILQGFHCQHLLDIIRAIVTNRAGHEAVFDLYHTRFFVLSILFSFRLIFVHC